MLNLGKASLFACLMHPGPAHPIRMGCCSYAVPTSIPTPLEMSYVDGPVGGEQVKTDQAPFWVAPNGIAYTRPNLRPGVLPRMLSEILGTRVMVKDGMKRWASAVPAAPPGGPPPPPTRVLQRVLNARQFGLKMISNVTYGSTSASFSGRMPFAELADTIVQSGEGFSLLVFKT